MVIRTCFIYTELKAALQLFKSGKIKYLIISGDNGTEDYDEPTTFKKDLVAKGIPASRIFLDYAGFRTLDSVVRCKKIFGQEAITVISQQFHNERAIVLAKAHGMKAVGYNVKNVKGNMGFKVKFRESLARVKLMVDLLIGKQPKFLGDPIVIPK